MKYLLLIILTGISPLCYSQGYPENKVTSIENGLTGEIIRFETSPAKKMNIHERMKHYKVNGLSIAVIDSGRLQWAKAYGVADAGSKEPVTTESLFQTASIGKMITALAALHLVREHKVSLDEDVNQKLTSWKVPESKFTEKEKVTLRRLLDHSAGFTDDYGFAGYGPNDSLPSLLCMLKAQPPANNRKALAVNYVPGTQVRYSGGGYLIIQQLIEDLTGTSYGKYVEREIFQKLELRKSTYNFYPDRTEGFKIARGHYENGSIDAGKKYHVYPEQAAAGFWSTPSDMARILIEMQREYNGHSEKILNRELMQTMLSAQSDFSNRGLGVVLKGAQQVDGFWHSGQNAGYNSLLYATTTTGQAAVIMLNSDGGIELAQEVVRSIANECGWPFMHTRHIKREHTDSLEKYTGTYKSKEGLEVRFSQKDNQLRIEIKQNGGFSVPYNLYRTEVGTYIITEAPDLMEYTFPLEKGQEAILHKHGGIKMILVKQ